MLDLSPELEKIATNPMEMAAATLDVDHKLLGAIAARRYQILREFDEVFDLDESEAKAQWLWMRRELDILHEQQNAHLGRLKSPVG